MSAREWDGNDASNPETAASLHPSRISSNRLVSLCCVITQHQSNHQRATGLSGSLPQAGSSDSKAARISGRCCSALKLESLQKTHLKMSCAISPSGPGPSRPFAPCSTNWTGVSCARQRTTRQPWPAPSRSETTSDSSQLPPKRAPRFRSV